MKQSPYPNISDELWDTLLETRGKETEEVVSAIVKAIFNETNMPGLSWQEIEGRKVAFRWGMRLGLCSSMLEDEVGAVIPLERLLEEEWIK